MYKTKSLLKSYIFKITSVNPIKLIINYANVFMIFAKRRKNLRK